MKRVINSLAAQRKKIIKDNAINHMTRGFKNQEFVDLTIASMLIYVSLKELISQKIYANNDELWTDYLSYLTQHSELYDWLKLSQVEFDLIMSNETPGLEPPDIKLIMNVLEKHLPE